MDGLLGGVAAINFLIFAIIFGMQGNVHDSLFALIIAVTLLAFLFFNFAPARIFMGDGGSLFLGGALAYCFTRLWNHPTQDKQLYLAIALISLPLFDMIRVFIYRLIRKRSPFIGDRSHFHHYLSKTGLHHAVSALIMYVFDMLLILQSILLSGFGLIEFAIANLLFFLLLFYIVREHSVFQDGKAWRRK
jgi:UDP-N-acetylmuramyl pentapeptide phosphotransferase/UDP-N-acetylglucosamine-1-phosphate transferase